MRKILLEGSRFFWAGVLTTVIYFGIAMFLIDVIGFNLGFSTIIAFSICLVISYVLHSGWSFKVEYSLNRFIRFTLAAILNLAVLLGISVLAESLHISNLKSVLLTCTLIPLASYLLNKIWVFR
ncbi:GtrA family protein [Shewanella sediminis]|uniref:GtrA family protein n=1 Tax=Shewanella sediminis TaxID=271097 RepID=UPI00059D19FC